MVVGCHQQPTIVASFFDNVKGLQMLHQQPFLTLTWQPSSLTMTAIFFDNGSHIIGNIPTITPFAIYVGNLSSCFFSTCFPAALPSLPF